MNDTYLGLPIYKDKTTTPMILNKQTEIMQCPCCGNQTRFYDRSLVGTTARALTRLYCLHKATPGHVWWENYKINLKNNVGGAFAKLRLWGLVRYPPEEGIRAGKWAITENGIAWVEGRCGMPRYVREQGTKPQYFIGPIITHREAHAYSFDLTQECANTLTEVEQWETT